MCHTSIYAWSVLWKILVLQKNCTSRESIKSSCCGKSLSSLYFCIKILSKNSSFFLLYFNLFPSLFSLCIFRFSSSLVHKTTRQTYSSLKYFLIMTFSGVCVFYFFLSSSCPEPHSSEEKTAFEHKKRRPRVKINQRRIHFEKVSDNSIVYITGEERKYSTYFHIGGGGSISFSKKK